jgi:predicted nucleic acid-binding protein
VSIVFVDTSAILALLNPKDFNHDKARRAFDMLRGRDAALVATSYVLVETYALLGSRMGLEAVRAFRADLAPLLEVLWVDAGLHEDGLDLMIDRGRRRLSLVDAVSFVAMRRRGIAEAFAFDPHFEDEAFALVTS